AKKSTQTDVSTTTPATSSAPIDIDLQSQLPAQCKGAIVETPALNLFQSFDDRFGDPLAGDLLRCFEKIARKVGSDSPRGHDVDANERMYRGQYKVIQCGAAASAAVQKNAAEA